MHNGQPLTQLLYAMGENLICSVERIVCCQRNAYFYQSYAHRLICDRQSDMGPLGGMLAILAAASHEEIFILPCDALGSMPADWVSRVREASADSELGSFVEDEGMHTPCCFLRKPALAVIESELASRHPTLRGFYARAGLSSVPISGAGRDWDWVE